MNCTFSSYCQVFYAFIYKNVIIMYILFEAMINFFKLCLLTTIYSNNRPNEFKVGVQKKIRANSCTGADFVTLLVVLMNYKLSLIHVQWQNSGLSWNWWWEAEVSFKSWLLSSLISWIFVRKCLSNMCRSISWDCSFLDIFIAFNK